MFWGGVRSKTYTNLMYIATFAECPPPWHRPRVGALWRPFGRPFGSGLETAIQRNSTKMCNFESNATHIQCNPIDIHSIRTIQSLKATLMWNATQPRQCNPIQFYHLTRYHPTRYPFFILQRNPVQFHKNMQLPIQCNPHLMQSKQYPLNPNNTIIQSNANVECNATHTMQSNPFFIERELKHSNPIQSTSNPIRNFQSNAIHI